MIAEKFGRHHLERKAILDVRQSSAHQVLHNRESGALQYAMRDRLTALGFSIIEVIAALSAVRVRLCSVRPCTAANSSDSDRYRSSAGRENHSEDTRPIRAPRLTSTL